MKPTRSSFAINILACFLLGACQFSAAGGPRAWIDMPLDNTTVPLGKVSVMAHASDTQGIAAFEFYANDQLFASSGPAEQGTPRLGHAIAEFTPAGPGVYHISVVAENSAGNTGAPAFVTVTVLGTEMMPEDEGCPPDCPIQPEEAPPAEEEVPPEEEEPQEPPPEPESPSQEVTVSFYANPASVQAGSGCATLHWDVEGTETVYWNGTSVYFRGMEDRCNLCESETHKLQVVKPDGTSEDHWVTIDVTGSCSAPAEEEPPEVDILPPDPIDTTPPGIFGAAANKSSMCPSETVTVNVLTGDEESPVKKVYANWTITGAGGGTLDSDYVEFSPISGQPYGYTAQIKSAKAAPGTLTINGTVENSVGLTANFTVTVTINVC